MRQPKKNSTIHSSHNNTQQCAFCFVEANHFSQPSHEIHKSSAEDIPSSIQGHLQCHTLSKNLLLCVPSFPSFLNFWFFCLSFSNSFSFILPSSSLSIFFLSPSARFSVFFPSASTFSRSFIFNTTSSVIQMALPFSPPRLLFFLVLAKPRLPVTSQ